MPGLWQLRWGLPGEQEESTVVCSVDELEHSFNRLLLGAVLAGGAIQADMVRADRVSMDPLLLQFVVGDRERGALLWHGDGEIFAAAQSGFKANSAELRFVRVDGVHELEASCSRIEPLIMRDALVALLLTDRCPDGLDWVEVPTD